MKKTITAHCLVKNEARFIWYSVMSVYDYVDKILLWDTGSTDGTLKIIDEILKIDSRKKIKFRNYGEVTTETFWKARQDMLDATSTDWFIVVDGDEVWWRDSIEKLVEQISILKPEVESFVVPNYLLIGDIFHYQEEKAGQYTLAGHKGHYNLRAVNKLIPGLHSFGNHGVWGWVDGDNKMIQDRDKNHIQYIEAPYLHATFIPRAISLAHDDKVPKRKKKLKYELGIEFPLNFYYPEVLFRHRPSIVPSVWTKMDNKYKLQAFIETPLKKLKRRLFPAKVGY